MNRKTRILVLCFVVMAVAAFAQKLPGGSPAATVDGVIGDKEYALVVPLDKLTLYASRTADTLFVALQGQTTGWVSFGAGSAKMDKAWIYIGYLKDGQAFFAAQRGAGHGHKDAGEAPKPEYKLAERDGQTILELSFRAADLIGPGQTELACIAAYGKADSLSSYHAFRRSVRIQL